MRLPYRVAWTAKPPIGTQINRSLAITQGLVGCWNFAEGGGALAYDHAQYGAGAISSTLGWAPAKSGIGINFPGGVTQSVTVPNNSSLPLGPQFAVAVRFLVTAIGTSQTIITKNIAGSTGLFELLVNPGGTFVFRAGNASTQQNLGVFTVVANTWYDVLCTCDATTAYVYVNGSLLTSAALTLTPGDTAFSIMMGNHGDLLSQLTGKIEYARVWNRALLAHEAMTLYRNPYAIMQPMRTLKAFFYPPVTASIKGTIKANIYAFKSPTARIVVQ